jgi:hypothetical protein
LNIKVPGEVLKHVAGGNRFPAESRVVTEVRSVSLDSTALRLLASHSPEKNPS